MKVIILAGGLGTRLSEETELKPKPMVEIGDRPILWHIMKHYSHFGFREFFVTLGYKGEAIKKYFLDCVSLRGDMSVDVSRGEVIRENQGSDDWVAHLIDTGSDTMTGGRIKRIQSRLKDEPVLVTYGDGVSDVNLSALVDFHRRQGRLATITAVRPPARFGGLVLNGDRVAEFTEKPQIGEGWINGGFMVLERGVMDRIEGDRTVLESDVLEHLAEDGQLAAFRHEGFWQCMDTLRDKRLLDGLWQQGHAPWKLW